MLSRSLPTTFPSRGPAFGVPQSSPSAAATTYSSPQLPRPGVGAEAQQQTRHVVPPRPVSVVPTPSPSQTSSNSNSRRGISSSTYTPAAQQQSTVDNAKKYNSVYNHTPVGQGSGTPTAGRPTPPLGLQGSSVLSSSASSIPAFQSKSGSSIHRRPVPAAAAAAPTTSAAAAGGDGGGEEGKKDRLRQEAVRELSQTEQDYINDLELVNEVFLKPLLSRNVLDKQELGSLFSNLEMLVGVNQEIMKGLKDDPNGDRTGQTFLGLMHYFKMYTVYCANQPHSDSTHTKCKAKNPAYASFLDECMADPRCRGLTLQSYLIKPIQRLCKYPLLLKAIYQNTAAEHADYESLREALSQMEKIVEYVNEGKRQAENSQKIMAIQSNIDGGEFLGLVQPTRRLLLESTFEVRVPKSKTKERYCVLFNDLFLCVKTKKKGTGYYDPLLLYLQVAKFIEISDTEEVHNSFEVQAESDGETKSAVFVFPTTAMKAEWAKEIKTIIRFYQKQRLLAVKKESSEKVAGGGSVSADMPSVRASLASPVIPRASPSLGRTMSSRIH